MGTRFQRDGHVRPSEILSPHLVDLPATMKDEQMHTLTNKGGSSL